MKAVETLVGYLGGTSEPLGTRLQPAETRSQGQATSAPPARTCNFPVGLSQSDGLEIVVVGVSEVLGRGGVRICRRRMGQCHQRVVPGLVVTRILPSGWGTATSESLSVLAWIWLMDLLFPSKRDGG